ncbi:polymorphic toxin-type HINT domain-containing protein [Psychrobacter sp. FDAARGOS_221]|uniref:polymorphic toxin-type HINT domain-containing protein n=1 Tax=Psychrobacter sp. FDAARGOS_221 TaxID=1975705 RepID=UPI00187D6664|nr:polymorphic toxin-type HINT domain-containing protein [Psychrobacter sp. FDAARGOS_221]
MTLLDKQGNATATIICQTALDETDTVYNFEVQDFSTYHIGKLGIWVHNADCCGLTYEAAPYHTNVGSSVKLKAPGNPQQALNQEYLR